MKITAKIEVYKKILKYITLGGTKPDTTGLPPSVNQLLMGVEKGLLDISYKYGKLVISVGKKTFSLTESDIDKALSKITLSKESHLALQASNQSAELALDTLFNKLSYKAYDLVAKNSTSSMSVGKIVSELRETTQDFNRDWHRVAITSMQNNQVKGQATSIQEEYGNKARVYKKPAPNCCKYCELHYLEKGTQKPKVFTLEELIANDTNYGKKTRDWKAVLSTMHPNCLCTLMVLPEGYELDDNGNQVRIK